VVMVIRKALGPAYCAVGRVGTNHRTLRMANGSQRAHYYTRAWTKLQGDAGSRNLNLGSNDSTQGSTGRRGGRNCFRVVAESSQEICVRIGWGAHVFVKPRKPLGSPPRNCRQSACGDRGRRLVRRAQMDGLAAGCGGWFWARNLRTTSSSSAPRTIACIGPNLLERRNKSDAPESTAIKRADLRIYSGNPGRAFLLLVLVQMARLRIHAVVEHRVADVGPDICVAAYSCTDCAL